MTDNPVVLLIFRSTALTMIKILIIDDHPLVIDGVKTMIKDVDYLQISVAVKTAREALSYLEQQSDTDIILLDINLPDIDGLRLCELIRAKNKTVKIIG